MTPAEKSLVQTSFAKVAPIAEQAAALFYGRLFEMDPSLRPLFKGDIREQGRKLMNMIAFCVQGLDALDQLVPAVQGLGKRHAGYGVTDAHYDSVGAALLWTLQQGLGEAWTPAVAAAWTAAYGFLSGIMRRTAVRNSARTVRVASLLDQAEPLQPT